MSKINKLGKSSVVIAILSFLLVAVLAFGGTYAYFSDTSNTVTGTQITLGTLYIDGDLAHTDSVGLTVGDYVVPNQKVIDSTITATVNSNINHYVRVKIAFKMSVSEDHTSCVNDVVEQENPVVDRGSCDNDKALTPITLDLATTLGLKETVDGEAEQQAVWIQVAGADEDGYTVIYLYKAAVQTAGTTHSIDLDATVNKEIGKGESQHWMGATFDFNVTFQVAQADYVETATPGARLTALTAADAWAHIA